MNRFSTLAVAFTLPVLSLCVPSICFAQVTDRPRANAPEALPKVANTAAQPLSLHVRRLVEAMDMLGEPLPASTREAIERALRDSNEAKLVAAVQDALDPHCLLAININPESRVKIALGPAKPELVENGWRQFLVKVHNEAGVTAELKADSPQAQRLFNSPPEHVADRWLDLMMFNGQPLTPKLTGLELEYRIVQLYSRDPGRRAAVLSFNVGQGTQDLGFRAELPIFFQAAPAQKLTFNVFDENNAPATAGLTIRDKQGRVYPSQAKRLAPDFAFHPQIYRHHGESVSLPPGTYTIEVTRGPEYLPSTQTITTNNTPQTTDIRLKRWVDPAKFGYWSGDHHIHAAGCAHYTNPTEGVHAPDMARHCQGEDLKVGANLTWGPCFDYQKQFFTGLVDKSSVYPYLLRYDVEVSGFGSHRSGHLCLLRLKEQMYPGGTSKDHWPTLGLNTLKWAKAQGAITGPAHSGSGLLVQSQELPNYVVPPYNGIGANEFIVDITHEVPGPDGKLVPAVDFISTVDTDPRAELNMWYHALNCGFRTRASGETDFPCIYGERVGMGRSYVKLDGKLDYDQWCEGIRLGRSYVSDGKSHIIDFKVNDQELGVNGSELKAPGSIRARITATVAARLPDAAAPRGPRLPVWDIQRARINDTRNVKLELIVNGYPVASKEITADGELRDVSFDDVKIDRSSWVAMRIYPSSHTNPIFVLVDNKPIRASRRSATWALMGVDACWAQKERTYDQDEKADARAAYDHARKVYAQILKESEVD